MDPGGGGDGGGGGRGSEGRGGREAVGDVLGDGCGEEDAGLRDDGDEAAEGGGGERRNVVGSMARGGVA